MSLLNAVHGPHHSIILDVGRMNILTDGNRLFFPSKFHSKSPRSAFQAKSEYWIPMKTEEPSKHLLWHSPKPLTYTTPGLRQSDSPQLQMKENYGILQQKLSASKSPDNSPHTQTTETLQRNISVTVLLFKRKVMYSWEALWFSSS